jgi:Helix-turn-helix of DDE superfamily endonuclease
MKPAAQFTRLVGVNYGAFQIILEKLNLQIARFKAEKPIRQRGKKSSLSIEDQLLLTLIYLRQYHTFLQLGEMFSISESYAQKRYEFISSQLLARPEGAKSKDFGKRRFDRFDGCHRTTARKT